MSIPYSRLLNDEELALYELEQMYSVCSTFLSQGMEKVQATFDLLIRDMPPHRNFLLAGGLEAVVQYLSNLRYSEDQIEYLLRNQRITKGFASYLKNFSFSGDVYAMPEGTLYFPGESMIRITAPIIEANLITNAVMALVTIDTLLFSKLARVRLAAKDKRVGIGFVRAHGIDAGWRASRAAYCIENMGISLAAASKRIKIESTPTIVAYHAFIKSFPNELTAMRAIAETFPDSASFMIDTYDFRQGIRNAITVAGELKERGHQLKSIILDSGDILEIAKYARKELDKAGHQDVGIEITGNIDEYKIDFLLKHGAPVDKFLIVTEVVTSADAPKLETVYKMSSLEENGRIRYTAKFAPGKVSLPGKKQVFRRLDGNGILVEDIIGSEEENLGTSLLQPVVRQGKLIYKLPSLPEIREYTKKQLALLPEKYKDIHKEYPPPVRVSENIQTLLEEVRAEHTELG